MNIDRVQFLEELKLREYIRKGIQIVVEKRQQNKNTLSEEVKLRKVIRELIQEVAIDDNEPSPHQSTGLNVLEVAQELERIGDYLRGISRINTKIGREPFVTKFEK